MQELLLQVIIYGGIAFLVAVVWWRTWRQYKASQQLTEEQKAARLAEARDRIRRTYTSPHHIVPVTFILIVIVGHLLVREFVIVDYPTIGTYLQIAFGIIGLVALLWVTIFFMRS